jgi:hypothetical protein
VALSVLQELHRNSPLANVHIYFDFRMGFVNSPRYARFMPNFLHLIASIDSINIPVSTDKYVADFLQKEYASAMFASARVLQTLYGFFFV